MTLVEWLQTSGVSQKHLAERLDVTQGAVSHWIVGRNALPAEKVLPLATATDYAVTPHELRPDLYPNATDGMPMERQSA
jgi:DNA-binding transcriptional regulator YdaS (Cro superfamily)